MKNIHTLSTVVSTGAIALLFSGLPSSIAIAQTRTNLETNLTGTEHQQNNLLKQNLELQAQARSRNSRRPPPPPPTSIPRGSNVGGGSLGGTGCGTTSEKLISLTPYNQSPALTTSEHPTLYFYMPYSRSEIEYGEFSVFTGANGMNRLYQAQFTTADKPGFISVGLPKTAAQALKTGETYHWYFKLYCAGNTEGNADVWVDGWIQRTTSQQRAWYDEMMQVMQQKSQPAAQVPTQLQTQWQKLLQEVDGDRQLFDWESLATQPYVGEVTITP
jgi:hypothetical protein